MDSLQVFRVQIRVTAGHLQGGMAQRPLQVKRASAPPQVVDRECVPEGMKRSGWWFKAQVSAQLLD
jgi:hypothetical protein